MAVTDAGTRWPRSRLAIGLLLSLVVLLVLGGFSFFTALSLQRQAAVQYAIGRLDPELSVPRRGRFAFPNLHSPRIAFFSHPGECGRSTSVVLTACLRPHPAPMRTGGRPCGQGGVRTGKSRGG